MHAHSRSIACKDILELYSQRPQDLQWSQFLAVSDMKIRNRKMLIHSNIEVIHLKYQPFDKTVCKVSRKFTNPNVVTQEFCGVVAH